MLHDLISSRIIKRIWSYSFANLRYKYILNIIINIIFSI